MEKELEILKKDYNAFLTRFYKGSFFLDNPLISMQEKEKALPGFRAIIKGLNDILDRMQSINYKPSGEEITEGFRI